MTSRLYKIGDALSQLINVAFLPNHDQTDANESTSARSYRCGWAKTQKFIDWIFSPWEKEHCKSAHENEIKKAKNLLERVK